MADGPKSYQGIMLSSTFTDLAEHRQKAIAAIQKLGFHAVGMESSGAQAADVITASLDFVRNSAAYIGIITKKYGQTPEDPERNPDGRSITELEFDEAMRLGRPILLFIMADDHMLRAADVERDPVKIAKLEEFTARAKRMHSDGKVERVWETFGSLQDFAEKIGHAVGKLSHRLKEEEEEEGLKRDDLAREVLARLDRLTIPERAVRGAIARFIDVRPDATEDEVVQVVETFETGYRALQEQVAAIATVDNHITSLKGEAEQALAEGDLDAARRLYAEAVAVAREKATEPVRATAQLLEAEAHAHLLALDWEAADRAWTNAASMLSPFDLDAAESIVWEAALNLTEHGDHFARDGALRVASDRWRSLADAADGRGDLTNAATLRNNLGNALAFRGERTDGEAGLALLGDAVAAYRAALTVRTEIAMPAQWAMTQENLAFAYEAIATLGAETRNNLGMAEAALRDALRVYTPGHMAYYHEKATRALARIREKLVAHSAA